MRPYATAEQWGQQSRTIQPAEWAIGNPIAILQRDAPDDGFIERFGHLPQVSTLLCGVENGDNSSRQDYMLRWELTVGVGGARVPLRFDAVGATRVVLPTEGFTLSLVVEGLPAPFPAGDKPAGPVDAFAMIGEGGVGQSVDQGPTHTTPFLLVTVGAAGLIDIPLPPGASAVRVVGADSSGGGIATPFRPQFLLQMLQGTSVFATLVGQGAAPADPSLRTLYYSDDYIPLPGSLTKLQAVQSDFPVTTQFAVQFKLDL